MPDFPLGLPTDIPQAAPTETLAVMHGGMSHVTATNRLLTNIQALASKLGIGAGGPSTAPAVLKRTADGQSGWGPVTDAEVDANAGVALAKLAHVGAGNLLRSNGTQNVGGKLTSGDITPGHGWVKIGPTQVASGGTTSWLTFTNIPQVYDMLVLEWAMRAAIASGSYIVKAGMQIGFSGTVFAANAAYHTQRMFASAGVINGGEEIAGTSFYVGHAPQAGVNAARLGRGTVFLPDYTRATDVRQMVSIGGSAASASPNVTSGLFTWHHYGEYEGSIGAIQCLQVGLEGFYIQDGSTAKLWGVPAS